MGKSNVKGKTSRQGRQARASQAALARQAASGQMPLVPKTPKTPKRTSLNPLTTRTFRRLSREGRSIFFFRYTSYRDEWRCAVQASPTPKLRHRLSGRARIKQKTHRTSQKRASSASPLSSYLREAYATFYTLSDVKQPPRPYPL